MSNTGLSEQEKKEGAEKTLDWIQNGADLFRKIQLEFFIGRERQEIAAMAALLKNTVEYDAPGMFEFMDKAVGKLIESGHIKHGVISLVPGDA